MKRILDIFVGVLIILCMLMFSGCQFNKENLSTTKTKIHKFAIFLVSKGDKDNAVSYGRSENGEYVHEGLNNINDLIIQDKPILTEQDIISYNWQNHEIVLTKDYINRNIENRKTRQIGGGSELLNTEDLDQFVIMVEGKRIYAGGFPLSPLRSQFNPEVLIEDTGNNQVSVRYLGKSDDPRKSQIIHDVFKELGKLKV